MSFAVQHPGEDRRPDNPPADRQSHQINRSFAKAASCLLLLACVVPANIFAQTNRTRSGTPATISTPASPLPSRKALLAHSATASSRPNAGKVAAKIQTRQITNIIASGRTDGSAQDERRLLLQKGSDPRQSLDPAPQVRAGYGRIFPDRNPTVAHPNDQRLEDRSWLYVKMSVKF